MDNDYLPVEQATAAPGELRSLPCLHNTLVRIASDYRCDVCLAVFTVTKNG